MRVTSLNFQAHRRVRDLPIILAHVVIEQDKNKQVYWDQIYQIYVFHIDLFPQLWHARTASCVKKTLQKGGDSEKRVNASNLSNLLTK